ncbi:hypermethylated in cancer 1 protein [Egretta garzetta]|uniref:hypermethylated in cancer 1 protein n=1 Tax=Egretta garzetta TaxID=188379 RepID=UPI00163C4918|nr:hypermethylated in cancer 1 protein [Egretta garzetta]
MRVHRDLGWLAEATGRPGKNILAASSAYLKSLVVHDNLLNLDHEMVSPGIFRLILDFIYTGRLAECEPGGEQSLGAVLAAASYLQIPGLVALCKKKLKRSGKYCHLRGGYAPYKLGRGLRAGEKEREREEKAESPPAAPQPRYPSVESNDLEPDNSTSEETGSSEGPSPGDALDRYCNHLGYEPESLGDNLYVCIPCGKGFPSSEQLNAHVEAHNEEELYHKAAAEQAVPFLDKGGPGLGDILRPYRCSSCDKSYKDPATLRQHEKTHWLTRPYPRTICGKKFTQRGTMTLSEQRNLISHMKMHAAGPDGKAKLDFPDSVYAMARLTADQLGLKQEKAAELLSHTSHFLSDPKAMESLYPLAKFTAEHLGLSQDKAAEVLAQAPHLHAEAARTIERYSPP